MKTLKESLLSDIEGTLTVGDEWEKNLKAETKEFLKALGAAKNYESMGFKDGRQLTFFTPNANVLNHLGYDANHIMIMIRRNFNHGKHAGEWKISIDLTKYNDVNRGHIDSAWNKTIYMKRDDFNSCNEVLKNLLKPAAKSLDTFKRFLSNVDQWDDQTVDIELLLN